MNKRKALQKGSDDSKSSASSSSAGLKEDTLFQATEVDRKVFDDLRNPNLSDSTSDDSFNKKQQAFQKKKEDIPNTQKCLFRVFIIHCKFSFLLNIKSN